MPEASASRRQELAVRLAAVRERVDRAALAAGRVPGEVRLVVVTKFFPASDVRLLAELGVTDVGESRDQEAAAKVRDCADAGLRWHFVGQVQSNKARSVAGYADVVHSLDRARLVAPLSRAAVAARREIGCFVQVCLDEADPAGTGRGGARPDEVPALAAAVAGAPGLRLCGVMAVAPREGDPAPAFARLQRIAARVREEHPQAVHISAGMSGDLEDAVACGATHVRVGSAVLGPRPGAR